MAKPSDLMGLGIGSPFLADVLGVGPRAITAVGASRASAFQLAGNDYLVAILNSNSGNGVVLPPLGGDNGCLLGDKLLIVNLSPDTLTVYANTSNTAIAASASNNSNFTLTTLQSVLLSPITASQWMGLKGN